jgi:hypothetical protein
MSHAHNVFDMDRHFIIDPITRSITNAGSAKTKLMQGDHNSECFSFEIDKVVEGHDMTLCNVVRIHYNNVDRSQGNLNRGLYKVKDLAVSSEDDSKVIFTWTISEQATMYAGGLSFLVEFKCVNDDGTVPYRWKSDVNNSISISSGINNDDYVVEEYVDILEQWKAEIDEALAQGGLTEEQVADLAANTEARHEHSNLKTLEEFYCAVSELENDNGMTILPDVVGLDRVSFRGNDLRYCSDGGVVRSVEEIEREDTKYLRLWFHRGDMFVENNLPEFIDIPVNLVTERVEEVLGPGLSTNSTGLELDLGMNSGEDSNHEHENGVPAVHTLPTNAKDGDMCLYAPQNTFTFEDSGKRIYFDWEEFRKPVSEDEWTSFGVACYNHSTDVVSLEMSLYRGTETCFISIVRMFNSYEMDGFSINFSAGELDTENSFYSDKDGVQTFYNSVDELPLYIDIPEFDQIDGNGLEDGNAYLFHTEYRLMKYQGGEWVEAVEVDISDIEYQTVTTDLAYEHKDLPIGEKTVTISGDGTFGNNAYIVSGEDMIPRKTYNRNFPYNGITVTRNQSTYHIEGVSSADGSVVFVETKNTSRFEIDRNIAGKTFKLLTFSNQYADGKMTFVVQFYDSNNNVVQVLKSNDSLSNSISSYMGSTSGYRETNFSIPENVEIKYVQAYITFKANYTFNHDFQFYVVEAENTQTVTLDNPTATITDENVASVFSAPYQSTTEVKAPIDEYIKYMTENAKGDTATYLTPEAFGAVGDGYADDINAITACLAMANATKQTVIMAKKYLVSAPIDLTQGGFNLIINDLIYSGTDAALIIHGEQNTLKIHSITSSGIGVRFIGDGMVCTRNSLDINSIVASSHGIEFVSPTSGVCQNVIKFSYISAGGDGCYGIYKKDLENDIWCTENTFYGGQIANCDWAVYKIEGNSKLYGIQVEYKVKGGFYITGNSQIIFPRWAESARDGEYPYFKFASTERAGYSKIISGIPLSINQIDLSENLDVYYNADGSSRPLHEGYLDTLEFPIMRRTPATGVDTEAGNIYCTKAYVWGKYLIMTPHIAYRKVVTTEELDTTLIGRTEETQEEVNALSQLPTKFVVDTVTTTIKLHSSYCAFGFNEFEVEQTNGFTCTIQDCQGNVIFDGTDKGDGIYRLNVYKDADISKNIAGLLRRDFTGHYWSVTKQANSTEIWAAIDEIGGGINEIEAMIDESGVLE